MFAQISELKSEAALFILDPEYTTVIISIVDTQTKAVCDIVHKLTKVRFVTHQAEEQFVILVLHRRGFGIKSRTDHARGILDCPFLRHGCYSSSLTGITASSIPTAKRCLKYPSGTVSKCSSDSRRKTDRKTCNAAA